MGGVISHMIQAQPIEFHIPEVDLQHGNLNERFITQNPIEQNIPLTFANNNTQTVTETLQSGANCGCYAAAMAMWALTYRPNDTESICDGLITLEVQDIAEELQNVAMQNGLSSLGEMFDAGALAGAINLYSQLLIPEHLEAGGKKREILAKMGSFNSLERFRAIIDGAGRLGLNVLVPYFSVESRPWVPDISDRGGDGLATPKEMQHAHWCVIQKDENNMVFLYEGHRKSFIKGISRDMSIERLFDSNMSLGDEFDWEDFLKNDSDGENRNLVRERMNRISADRIMDSPFIEDGGGALREIANLRGRVVLVGIKRQGNNTGGDNSDSASSSSSSSS